MTPADNAPLPSAVLSAAADLIEPEGAWTQGAFARPDPRETLNTPRWPDVRVCWCLRGAIAEAARVSPHELSRLQYVEDYLERVLPDDNGGVDFNDAPERTQVEVVAALRKAAELAREAGQ